MNALNKNLYRSLFSVLGTFSLSINLSADSITAFIGMKLIHLG